MCAARQPPLYPPPPPSMKILDQPLLMLLHHPLHFHFKRDVLPLSIFRYLFRFSSLSRSVSISPCCNVSPCLPLQLSLFVSLPLFLFFDVNSMFNMCCATINIPPPMKILDQPPFIYNSKETLFPSRSFDISSASVLSPDLFPSLPVVMFLPACRSNSLCLCLFPCFSSSTSIPCLICAARQ